MLAAQSFKPQAKVLAADRGIVCVQLDYDELRGLESGTPDPVLIAARGRSAIRARTPRGGRSGTGVPQGRRGRARHHGRGHRRGAGPQRPRGRRRRAAAGGRSSAAAQRLEASTARAVAPRQARRGRRAGGAGPDHARPPSSPTWPTATSSSRPSRSAWTSRRALFAELDGLLRDDAVLATNTSALSVTDLATVDQPAVAAWSGCTGSTRRRSWTSSRSCAPSSPTRRWSRTSRRWSPGSARST